MVSLSKECSAILQNKIPRKVNDPGCFTIPIEEKDLVDLGASINLMPKMIFKKLGLGEPKLTRMTLQLANRSIRHPRGVIKDTLLKVDGFLFLADFDILDLEDDGEVSLIFLSLD